MKKLLFCWLFCLLAISSLGSIVVTIGTGTGSNAQNTYPAPYGNYYWGARHQFLYTAPELTAAGLGAGNITTVAFNVTAVNGSPAHQGYTVQMKNSASSDLLSWESGLTTVLNPAARTPVLGWNTYNLDLPFYWDGLSNLVVEVCFNNTSWVTNASTQWTTGLPGVYARWYRNDMAGVCSMSSLSGADYIRPNIQLTGQPASPCTGTPDPGNTISTSYSLCPNVNFTLSLQNFTPGGGVNYQWQKSTSGGDPWTNIGTSTTTYTTSETVSTYYRCQVTCSGNTGNSVPALVAIGTPVPGNTLSTINPACAGVSFTLSLQYSTVGVDSYQWQMSPSGSDPWTNIGTSSPSYTTTQTATNYYRCQVSCGGNTGTSTPVQVVQKPFYDCYCSSVATRAEDEEIYSVTVGNITNAYNCYTVAPGPGSILKMYSNFTTLGPLFTLPQSDNVSFIILEDECDGPTYYANGCAMWVDFNQDGDFIDTGEQVYTETGVTYSPRAITGNISVPAGATLGVTGMRISVAEGIWGPSLTPCLSYNYGETEDYLVTISPPVACPQPFNLTATSITTNSANLGWTKGSNETDWEFAYGIEPFPLPSGPGIATSSNTDNPVSGLSQSTSYQYYVRADCGEEFSEWSGPYTFKTLCTASPSPLFENFDAASPPYLPDCWSKKTISAMYGVVETAEWWPAHSYPNGVKLVNSMDPSAILLLISPELSDPINTLHMDFWAKGGTGYTIIVGTMTDPANAGSFTPITTVTLDATYKEYDVSFSTYSGADAYIAIKHGLGGNNLQIYMDDIMIYNPSSLAGFVYDYQGNPLPGANVSLMGGISTISGPEGDFEITPLTPGNKQFQCTKAGYNTSTAAIDIPHGTSVNQDFTLTNPEVALIPPEFYEVLLPSEISTYNLTIQNDGSGLLNWQSAIYYTTASPCNYTINLFDVYGDGWNGGTLDVLVSNIVVLNDITLANGFGPVSVNLVVNSGDQITTVFSPGGWPTEPYYTINNDWGTQVWVSPASNSGPPNILPGQLIASCYSDDWLTMNVNSGIVLASGNGSVSVSFDATKAGVSGGVPGETYSAEIRFDTDPDIGQVDVPVTLAIADETLDPATNLTLFMINPLEGKFKLVWSFNPSRSFSNFIILRNGQLIGSSSTNSFIDDLDMPGHYCYKVCCVYENGSISVPSNVVCLDYPLPPSIPVANWAIILGALLIGGYAFIMIRRRT